MHSLSQWIQSIGWIAATEASPVGAAVVEVSHYFSMFLLVGSMALVDLRILGVTGRSQTASELGAQVFPTMWVGFVLVTITGCLQAAATATQYYNNDYFWLKIAAMFAATVVGIVIERNVSKWDRLPAIPVWAKVMALLSLVLWIGTILAGVEVPALTGVG
jgi:hypothetical protein